MNRLFQVLYVLFGGYFFYLSYILFTVVPDGDGIGFFPFGIEVLLPNNSIVEMGFVLSIIGGLFIIYPLCALVFSLGKKKRRRRMF